MKCYYFVFVVKKVGAENSFIPEPLVPRFDNEDIWKNSLLSKYPIYSNLEMIVVNDNEWAHPELNVLDASQPLQLKPFLDAMYRYLTTNLGYFSEQAVAMLNITYKNKIVDIDYKNGILRIGTPFEWEDETPVLEEPPVQEAPALEEPPVQEAPALEEPPVQEAPALEEPPVQEAPALEEPPVQEAPAPSEPVMNSAFCNACGFSLSSISSFCPNCGTPLKVAQTSAPNPIPVPIANSIPAQANIVEPLASPSIPPSPPLAEAGTGIPSLYSLACTSCGSGVLDVLGEKGSASKAFGTTFAFGAIGNIVASSSAQKNMTTNPIEYRCTACKNKFVTMPQEAQPHELLESPCTIHFTRVSSALGAAIAQIVYLNGMKIGAVKNGKELVFSTPIRYNTIFVTDQHGAAFPEAHRFEATPNGHVSLQFKRKFL